jgi:TonB family protein
MKRFGFASFVLVMGMALPAAAQFDGSSPQGPLNAAKDLYASARYDEALSVLNGLRIGESVDRKSVEQYRSLCLLALGRASEAETAIEAVVTADPTYRPGESESPRVRATFTVVRKRLLPEITTAHYQAAKAAYDRKEWAASEHQFRTVLDLIDDPDTGGRLGDLRVLAVGFLELSARAAAPPPPPPPVEPKPTSPAPVSAPPAATAGSAAAEAPAGPVPGRIYTAEDAAVRPPTVVRQEIPSVPQSVMAMVKPRGLVEVVIDEQGRVISMAMRGSLHPTYDALILTAARDWKYQPARYDGQPVRFRRLISVAVKR